MRSIADNILDTDNVEVKSFKRVYRLMVKQMQDARKQAIEAASKRGTNWLYANGLTEDQINFINKCNQWAGKFLQQIDADDPGDPPTDSIE